APSLHAAADAAADRRMEAVNASRHAILLRRAGGDPRADRLETAALALGALAFARGTARPRTVAGAAPGNAGDRRCDASATGLRQAHESAGRWKRVAWVAGGRSRSIIGDRPGEHA